MLATFGSRQQQLLRLLLEHKPGMSVDELAESLEITRTAVTQHLAALERDGYVEKGDLQKTGGRPGWTYVLTPSGVDLFPKQYSWFAKLLLETIKRDLGSQGLANRLDALAAGLAGELERRLAGKDPDGQVAEIVAIMNELGYTARPVEDAGELPLIEAKNCVYHDLAREHPEVCQFDLGLLSNLMHRGVEHLECMVRGGNACRFRFRDENKRFFNENRQG
jgi:predicted ArsR family transcriptional regulator